MRHFEKCTTLDEAKREYYRLALQLHPDRGGDTAKFQDMLNQFHAFRPGKEKYAGEAASWDGLKYAAIINDLLKIPAIKVIICGSWIWLQGDTKPVKEQIKAINTGDFMRRGWSKDKGQWYFSPAGYRKRSGNTLTFGQIANLYGYEEAKQSNEVLTIN